MPAGADDGTVANEAIAAAFTLDAGRKEGEPLKIAVLHRERLDLLGHDVGGRIGLEDVDERRLPDHVDRLGDLGDLHRHAQVGRLAHPHDEPFFDNGREPGQLELDGVAAGRQGDAASHTDRVGDDRLLKTGVRPRQRHGHAGQRRARFVNGGDFDDRVGDLRGDGRRERHPHGQRRTEEAPGSGRAGGSTASVLHGTSPLLTNRTTVLLECARYVTGVRLSSHLMRESGLRNKVAIVTGGAAGLGQATARRFADEGCRVAIWDVHGAALPAAADQIFSRVDVADRASVESGVADVLNRWGQVDILVNNAGILRDAQLVKWKDGAVVATLSDESFDAVIGVNLRGVFLCTRAVVPHMIAAGGGVVLNAASVVGLYGNFGQTSYAAAKAAVINMTRTWARELGKYNIRVNAVAPGFIATDMVRSMPAKALDSMVSNTPLGRMGDPDDIAEAYAWLASDRARFVHGAVLSVDGGLVVGT